MAQQGPGDDKHAVERIENRSLQVYDSHSAPQAPSYVVTDRPLSSTDSGLLALGAWARTVQDLMQQQMALFHQFDSRLSRIEQATQKTARGRTLEQQTWWALWSITMLLLGAALTVVIFVILMTVLR